MATTELDIIIRQLAKQLQDHPADQLARVRSGVLRACYARPLPALVRRRAGTSRRVEEAVTLEQTFGRS